MKSTSNTLWQAGASAVVLHGVAKTHGLRVFFWLLAILLGAIPAWAAVVQRSMNPDGIAYLDLGDAYWRGDWQAAVNGYWSPLYAWLLMLPLHLLRISPYWEFSVVQLVNFVIYLGALASFDFFWHELLRSQRHTAAEETSKYSTLPEWAWLAVGYTLFIWSSLYLIEIWAVTPDMAVAAWVYLAAGIILRIRRGAAGWRSFALLGLVLGLGYLTKAAMYPMAFVFLGVSLFAAGGLRKALPRLMIALLVFLIVSGPLVVSLSAAKGRLTFGDSGRLNYVRYVNGLPEAHWQGDIPGNGSPLHPTRQIYDDPPVYEFASPVGGTYPPWYDQSYWYDGVVLHFDVWEQLVVLASSMRSYFDLFFRLQGGMIGAALILYWVGCRQGSRLRAIAAQWYLLVPAVAALGMYALVLPETRYVGAFVVLLWAGVLSGARLPDDDGSRKLASAVGGTLALFLAVNIITFNLAGLDALVPARRLAASRAASPSPVFSRSHWDVASGLAAIGIQPGDTVAFVGYSFDAFWARLARVRIIAETQDATAFWAADDTARADIVDAFAATRARAIISERLPDGVTDQGWRRIGNTAYFVYLLPR